MSLLKTSLEGPPLAIPFKVRMEPYLIESICELARLVRDKGASNNDISGLLFGKVEQGVRSVEALRTFVDMGPHSELARRQRWEKAYLATADEAKNDPELSQFEIVGWFSFRTGSGLLSSDVVFHNQHFRKSEDVALIVWREGPSQMNAEVYSKSENDILTSDDYRWGSVRLSADIRHMSESVELAMRMKMDDDSYLRTYGCDEPLTHFETLKRRAEAVSDKLLSFLNKGKEEAFTEKVSGLIGDGRLPGGSKPMLNAIEPVTSPQAYFNPYSDAPAGRQRPGLDDSFGPSPTAGAPSTAPTPAPPPAWPGSGSGFGTAPARIPEFRRDVRFSEDSMPLALPPPGFGLEAASGFGTGTGFDLAQIGRTPRTGRAIPNEIGGLPMLLRPPTPPKASPWPWTIGIFLLCSSLVFGFLALGGLHGENGRLGQLTQAVFPGSELNLRVRNEDDRLRLSWNQRNHAVASASDATLQIFDGQLSREIHLDGRQVADGSVLYRPLTNDVTFRLAVRGEQGSATGSVRLLDSLSSRQATLDVSSPIQNASARMPYESPLTGDPTAPTLLRDGGTSPNYPPTTESMERIATGSSTVPVPAAAGAPLSGYVPQSGTRATHTTGRNAAPRYKTPETIRTLGPAQQVAEPNGELNGGATINGWDTTPATRSKTKTHTQTPVSSGLGGIDAASTNYVPPRPLVQIMPNVRSIPVGTLQARTRVTVKVNVDQAGHVSYARVTSPGVSAKVSAAAVSAAKQWLFDPAKDNGHRVSSEHTIIFVLPAR